MLNSLRKTIMMFLFKDLVYQIKSKSYSTGYNNGYENGYKDGENIGYIKGFMNGSNGGMYINQHGLFVSKDGVPLNQQLNL